MAFAVKYRLEIATLEGNIEKIDISEDGYAGAVINLKGGSNPLKYIKGQKGGAKNKVIIPSTLEFSVYSETDFAYTSLSSFQEQTYLVEYYQGATKVFSGWLLPDEYSEDYIEPPYEVGFIATDYLAQLKGIQFLTTVFSIPNQPYTGRNSLLFYIKEALLKTGLSLNIRENVNIYSTEMDTASADSPLVQGDVDASIFFQNGQALDCYSVLEFCIKNFSARLVQDGNTWYIEQINEKQNTTFIERTYNSAGVYQSQTTITPLVKFTRPYEAQTRRLLRGGNLDSDRDLKDVSVYYQQTQSQGADTLRGFSNGSDWVDASTLQDWTLVGASSVSRIATNNPDFPFLARINGSVSSLSSASYLESQGILLAATDSFSGEINIQFRINATSITTKGARAYYQLELDATDTANVYYFQAGSWFINDVKILYSDTKQYNQPRDLKITIPPIPEDGTLRIRIYQVLEVGAGIGAVQSIQFTKFSLTISSQPDQTTAWLVNRMFFNERVSFQGEREIVLIGDGPGPGTPGGVQVSGTIATDWARRGVTESRTLIEMYLQLWANLFQRVGYRLQASLRLDGGVTVNWTNTFADQDSVSTRKYYFSYYEWTPRFNTLTFEGIEYIAGDATVNFETFTREDLERTRWDLFPTIPFNPFPGLIPEVPTFTFPVLGGDVINEAESNVLSPASIQGKPLADFTIAPVSSALELNIIGNSVDEEIKKTTPKDLFNAWAVKATPIAADKIVIIDSADSDELKVVTGVPLTMLGQGGATTGQAVVWDGTKWAAGTVEGSKWTEVANGIYRNGRVAIGTTTVGTVYNFAVTGKSVFIDSGQDVITARRTITDSSVTPRTAIQISVERTGGVLNGQGAAFSFIYDNVLNNRIGGLSAIKRADNSGEVQVYVYDSSSTATVGAVFLRNAGAYIGSRLTTAAEASTEADSLEVKNRIKTGDFTGTTARYWKLGERKAATVLLDTTQYITVKVDGTIYNLALATV
jgi:hypothetical protein